MAVSRFDVHTTSAEAAEALKEQIKGKVVVVTGISPGGIAADAVREIFAHDPKLLVLASRSQKNIDSVISSLAPQGADNLKPLVLDLASQESVRKAAAELLEMTPVVDVLINNAALFMLQTYQTSPEGIELQFAVNHIGHFLFTNLIMDALLKAKDGARVVNVSSRGHVRDGVSLDDYNFSDGATYDPVLAYARSKSANVLFSIEFGKRYANKGIESYSVHPGTIWGTNLARDMSTELREKMGWIDKDGKLTSIYPWKSVQQGSAGYIVAAFDPALKDYNGAYLEDSQISAAKEHATDPVIAGQLWELSEKLVGQKF